MATTVKKTPTTTKAAAKKTTTAKPAAKKTTTTAKKAAPVKKTTTAAKPAAKNTATAKPAAPAKKTATVAKPAAKPAAKTTTTAKMEEKKNNSTNPVAKIFGLFSSDKFKDPFAKDMVKVCAGQYRTSTWASVLRHPGGDKRRKKEYFDTNIGYRTMTLTKEYLICKYVVTQKQWKLVMGEGFNPSVAKGDDLPVTNVSYDDIMKFIKKLNTLTGKKYRLPSEAEWEWAARGASKDDDEGDYAGCDTKDKLSKYAWYRENSDWKIHPVGKKKSNELGLYDMSGNVWEICLDMYSNNKAVSGEDYIEKDGEGHVKKGGCFMSDGCQMYISYRNGNGCTGFRLAHDIE